MLSPIIGATSTAPSNVATTYIHISGGASWTGTETAHDHTMPAAATLSKLHVSIGAAQGAGTSRTFTLMKNGSATGVTVTIADAALSATDLSNSVSYAEGDTISLRSVPSGTPGTTSAVRWNVTCDAAGQILFGAGTAVTTTASYTVMGVSSAGAATGIDILLPCAGTFSKLYAKLTAEPGAGTSKAIVLHKNNAAQTLTTTIADAATTGTDTSNSVTFAEGDRVSYRITVSGAPASSAPRLSTLFTPSVDGDSFVGIGLDASPSTGAAAYAPVVPNRTWDSSEVARRDVIGDWQLKKLLARTTTASGAAKDRVLTVRLNTADTGLSVTMANTTTVQTDTDDITVVQGDGVAFMQVPTGTPTASRINVGLLLNAPSSGLSGIKEISTVAQASVKKVSEVAEASVKKVSGVAN